MAEPGTDPLTQLAASALNEIEPLARRLIASIALELPELADDARIRELFESTVLDNVVTALRMLSRRGEPVDLAPPPVALEFARRLAQQGIPITVMLRAYRLGQAAFNEELIGQLAAEDITALQVAVASNALSRITFTYIDTVSEHVVAAYQQERENWLRHRNANRLATVRSTLSGRLTDPDDVSRGLGFNVTAKHVGAVVWSGALGGAERLAGLERQVTQLAAALESSRPLSVAPDDSTIWAWFAVPNLELDVLATRLADLVEPLHVALGEPASGLAGFRATHQQAVRAQALALAAGPESARPITAYSKLGPLALVATEVPDIAGWVQAVLGGLAADDDANARLRETLWTYLSRGSNSNTAATELHLHKNTVQYRIRKAEEARGKPLTQGRVDVEVALLACRVLGSTVLHHADT